MTGPRLHAIVSMVLLVPPDTGRRGIRQLVVTWRQRMQPRRHHISRDAETGSLCRFWKHSANKGIGFQEKLVVERRLREAAEHGREPRLRRGTPDVWLQVTGIRVG